MGVIVILLGLPDPAVLCEFLTPSWLLSSVDLSFNITGFFATSCVPVYFLLPSAFFLQFFLSIFAKCPAFLDFSVPVEIMLGLVHP